MIEREDLKENIVLGLQYTKSHMKENCSFLVGNSLHRGMQNYDVLGQGSKNNLKRKLDVNYKKYDIH